MEKENETTKLKNFFKKNHNEIIKYLIELYEFQENIKITFSVNEKGGN